MSVQRPYGQWDSPVEADSYTQTSVQLSQVRVDETDTYWVEGNPRDNGRNTLLRADSMGQISEVLPLIDGIRLPDVRTRVHEYGGRAYAVSDGFIVFSDGFDGRVYAFNTRDPRRQLVPLTPLGKVRYGDFEIADVRGLCGRRRSFESRRTRQLPCRNSPGWTRSTQCFRNHPDFWWI